MSRLNSRQRLQHLPLASTCRLLDLVKNEKGVLCSIKTDRKWKQVVLRLFIMVALAARPLDRSNKSNQSNLLNTNQGV